MSAKTPTLFFLLSLSFALRAETINCKKTENAESVFSMNTQNLQAHVSTAGTSLPMKCRIGGEKSWRCFA